MKKRGTQFDALKAGLAAEAKGMDPEDRSFVEGALRHAGTGHTGPIDAMDADTIERTHSAVASLRDFGFDASPIGRQSPRGVNLNIGTEHQVSITPVRSGFGVSIRHPDRFATTDAGDYAHPEGWGEHDATLNVTHHDLPGALMEHFANPEVRKRAAL